MSNEGAVVFVNFYLERGWNTEQIANEMLDYCLRKGSKVGGQVCLDCQHMYSRVPVGQYVRHFDPSP
jgi:hypothetical protein